MSLYFIVFVNVSLSLINITCRVQTYCEATSLHVVMPSGHICERTISVCMYEKMELL